MARRKRVHALLSLPADLVVAEEVLGRAFAVSIGGIGMDLTFPVMDGGKDAPQLVAPSGSHRGSVTLRRFPPGDWGHRASDACWAVSALAASLLISPASAPTSAPEMRVVADHFDPWYNQARQWICACRRYPLGDPTRTRGTILRGFAADGRPWGFGGFIHTVLTVGLAGASLAEVGAAFARATRHEPLPLPHELLLDAQMASLNGERRRAVIDAGTAAEVALATALADHLGLLGAHGDLTETVVEQANGLVGLAALYEAGVGSLPVSMPRLKNELAGPRNRAAHRGAALSQKETAAALVCARTVVDKATPLAFP